MAKYRDDLQAAQLRIETLEAELTASEARAAAESAARRELEVRNEVLEKKVEAGGQPEVDAGRREECRSGRTPC